MVSLDDAVLARLEKGGSRYEILVDPELVDEWKKDHASVSLDDLLATDEIWNDARSGDRPTTGALENVFGSTDLLTCVEKILIDGNIQLTTVQRKNLIAEKRTKIIHQIATTATDPRTKLPHPKTRIELALDEIKFSIDPFLSLERQV
ncbi:ribosome assembly factor SBDS, partial [Euryarchaeota archaeon]|nr:ribosome assembly factor SBDS [Euryarchaeota archaeon]